MATASILAAVAARKDGNAVVAESVDAQKVKGGNKKRPVACRAHIPAHSKMKKSWYIQLVYWCIRLVVGASVGERRNNEKQ